MARRRRAKRRINAGAEYERAADKARRIAEDAFEPMEGPPPAGRDLADINAIFPRRRFRSGAYKGFDKQVARMGRAVKRMTDGAARHENRRAQRPGKNADLIERMLPDLPDMLDVPVTIERLKKYWRWVRTHREHVPSPEALARMIRRARRQRPQVFVRAPR